MSHSWFRTGKHTFYSDTSHFQTILSFWELTTSNERSLLYRKFSRSWIFFPTKQNLPLKKESRVTLLECSKERIEKIIGTIFTLHLLCGFKLLSQFQIPSKHFKVLCTQNNLLKLLIHFFQQTLPKINLSGIELQQCPTGLNVTQNVLKPSPKKKSHSL